MRRSLAVVALCGVACSHGIIDSNVTTQSGVTPGSEAVVYDGTPATLGKSRYSALSGSRGMVVSDDRVASEWGAEILRKGGNAIDAAVATGFMLSVTRPHYGSLGGGGFMVYCPKSTAKGPSPCTVVDYRESAPAESRRDMYVEEGTKVREDLSKDGALASGVPGVPAGLLLALEKFGTKPRKSLISRPIELARKGVPMSSYTEVAAHARWDAMNDEAKRIFGCKGAPCSAGTLIRQPELAKVLEKISAQGASGFYYGEVAAKIAGGLKKGAGILSLEDLASYRPQIRVPISVKYRGNEVVTMPPPSAGGVLIAQMFKYMESADAEFSDGFGSARTVHALGHAMSLSFADRAKYFGDPDHIDVPVETLLSDAYLASRWKTFDPDKAVIPADGGEVRGEGSHTTHFSVIDHEGNAVAVTTTINDYFGSGFVPPGTGIVMNNEMDDFAVRPGVPNLFGLVGAEANAIAPKKRPLSSMSPTIVRDERGNARIVIGAAGGPRITTAVFLSLLNRLRFEMSLMDAIGAPRIHHQWKPESLMLEKNGFSSEVRAALSKRGWKVAEIRNSAKIHALERFPNGRVWGIPDYRGEGVAVAE
jgi:gamma-glutamyltranspeptidase / glutathione hydrolase